jgi:hypothetical protein
VTGKLRVVWAFVMVLACSRHMFVRPVLKMDQRAWTECHGPVGVGKSHVAQALAHLAILWGSITGLGLGGSAGWDHR